MAPPRSQEKSHAAKKADATVYPASASMCFALMGYPRFRSLSINRLSKPRARYRVSGNLSDILAHFISLGILGRMLRQSAWRATCERQPMAACRGCKRRDRRDITPQPDTQSHVLSCSTPLAQSYWPRPHSLYLYRVAHSIVQAKRLDLHLQGERLPFSWNEELPALHESEGFEHKCLPA